MSQFALERNGRAGATAVLKRRWPTLAAVASTVLLAVVGQSLPDAFPVWSLVSAALVYPVWGAVRAWRGRPGLLPVEMAGLLAFGALSLVVLAVSPEQDLGRYLLAAGWVGHAVWDALHHRADRVVPRWYSEWCAGVDVLVAVAVLFLP